LIEEAGIPLDRALVSIVVVELADRMAHDHTTVGRQMEVAGEIKMQQSCFS
jgi:hypothetical protein